MSLEPSVGPVITILQLAWTTFQNAKKACGEHDELTREIGSLCKALRRVQREVSQAPADAENSERRKELDDRITGCEDLLRFIHTVLRKYNALGDDKKERQAGLAEDQIWEWRDARLGRHQAEVIYTYCGYWCNLKLYILGGLGRVETRLQNQGDNLKDIRESINWIVVNTTATKSAKGESSVRTAYENDDREFWRDLRRQLLKERFLGAAVQRKQSLIRAYVTALAKKEVLDEDESDGDEASMNTKEAASDSQARILEDIIKSQKEDSG